MMRNPSHATPPTVSHVGREADVGQDVGRFFVTHGADGCATVFGGDHIIATGRQLHEHRPEDEGAVIHD